MIRKLEVILLESPDAEELANQLQNIYSTEVVIHWDIAATNEALYCFVVIQKVQ